MPFILTRCLGPIGPGQLGDVRSNTDGKGIAGKHLDQQFIVIRGGRDLATLWHFGLGLCG